MTSERRRLSPQSVYLAARLAMGLALLAHEALIREAAQIDVLAAGLALLAFPEARKFDRWWKRLQALAAAEVAEEEEEGAAS